MKFEFSTVECKERPIKTSKVLFLDRDGIINVDDHYVHTREKFIFIPEIFPICRHFQDRGYKIIVVTNQSGIGRGYFDIPTLNKLHFWMIEEFAKQGITITDVFFCPFVKSATIEEFKKDSDLRKPKPGMFIQAAQKWNLELDGAVMIGDKLSDRIEHPGIKCHVIKGVHTSERYDFDDHVGLMRELGIES